MTPLPPQGNSARSLANWISETPKISDPLARTRATAAFIDTISCILAATTEPAPENVFNALRFAGNGICSVIGRAETLSAENAVLVNATAAHALDYDDNFLPAVTHASAVLVPSLLALGEEVGASGDQLLDAYIIGLEVQAWLGRHMIPTHYAAGWHATSTIGTIGAAAACVRILALDNQSALNALSLATSMAGGSKLQFGSMAKPLHAGLAARAGITAARLASAGVSANENPFDGPWGFMALHHSQKNELPPKPTQLSILSDGLAQKRWPCCGSAHRSLDAIQVLMQKHQIDPQQIEQIETVIPDSNYKNLRFNHPQNPDEARFSMTYCAAVMALQGSIGLKDFTPTALQIPETKTFMTKILMVSAGTGSDAGDSIWDFPATTTITTKDQQQYQQLVHRPVGTIDHPLGQNELYQKYKECSAFLLSETQSEQLFSTLLDFENQKIRHIAPLLRRRGQTPAEKQKPHPAI